MSQNLAKDNQDYLLWGKCVFLYVTQAPSSFSDILPHLMFYKLPQQPDIPSPSLYLFLSLVLFFLSSVLLMGFMGFSGSLPPPTNLISSFLVFFIFLSYFLPATPRTLCFDIRAPAEYDKENWRLSGGTS